MFDGERKSSEKLASSSEAGSELFPSFSEVTNQPFFQLLLAFPLIKSFLKWECCRIERQVAEVVEERFVFLLSSHRCKYVSRG